MRNAVCRSRSSSSSRRPPAASSSAPITRSRSASCWAMSRSWAGSNSAISRPSYLGRMIWRTSATRSGRVRFSAARNCPAAEESAMARRTVGRLLATGPGRYTAGRPWASNGATWRPSSSRMIGLARAGPGCPPHGRMAEQEGVQTGDPLIGLRLEKLPGHSRDHVQRRDLVDADLFTQVAPQDRRELLGNRLVREPDRPVRAAQRAELIRVEELAYLRATGQLQVNGHAITA